MWKLEDQPLRRSDFNGPADSKSRAGTKQTHDHFGVWRQNESAMASAVVGPEVPQPTLSPV
jgi:hypothetical protein